MAAAHRLLAKQASEPSSSSQVTHLLHRQRLYERIIRIFISHPSSERVTIPSLFQRMFDEGVPPNLDTLKIVLATAGRHEMPILPILRDVLEIDGLPDKIDIHLLGLVGKALVREGGMKPDDLERMLEECTAVGVLGAVGRPIVFDELLVEAYGQAGDLRGILNVLARYRTGAGTSTITTRTPPPHQDDRERGILSLYLQAIRQWISNPAIRRKRRGSLFPRILAKDLVDIYGGTGNLPLVWLNTWMNAERIANDPQAALTVWHLIGSQADHVSYATYFLLSKLLPTRSADLRATVSNLVAYQNEIESASIKTIEAGLSASLHHDDLPLALFLARQVVAKNTKAVVQLKPTERTIDIIAAGLVRAWRKGGLEGTMGQSSIIAIPSLTINAKSQKDKNESLRDGPEYIVRDEWDFISTTLGDPHVTLPLSHPLGRLSPLHNDSGEDDTTVMTFHPPPTGSCSGSGSGSRSAKLGRALEGLIRVLEDAVVETSAVRAKGGSAREVLVRTMQELHRQIIPER